MFLLFLILFYNIYMKKIYLLSVLLLITFVPLFLGCADNNKNALTYLQLETKGVWWWDNSLKTDTYLTFAKNNGINEIYFCDSRFNNETAQFIEKANENKIEVYFLCGEYQWLTDASSLYKTMENYLDFQSNYPNANFSGVHLDIEPHQDPNFDTTKEKLILSLINLSYNLKSSYPSVSFDYDLPFWLEDEIEFNQQTLPAFAHIMNNANRVFLMSYRDTAEQIYNVSSAEIEYAKSNNKTLVLGVETKSNEGDNVSFMEEGKEYMNLELEKLSKMLPDNFGISIHQIKTWYSL